MLPKTPEGEPQMPIKLWFFSNFASCSDRTPQISSLIWWTWLNLAQNFASKLDARSNPPPPPPRPPDMEVPQSLKLDNHKQFRSEHFGAVFHEEYLKSRDF